MSDALAIIAALLWTLAPNAHASEIRAAITNSAHDLGASGARWRNAFVGTVDALGWTGLPLSTDTTARASLALITPRTMSCAWM